MSIAELGDIEVAPAEMEREKISATPLVPPSTTRTPSFFCSIGFILPAAIGTLLLGLLLFILLLPLTWIAALLVFPATFITFYMNSFMTMHDWAEKVPVLLIKFFNAERSLWPTPRFADIVDDEDDPTDNPGCCAKVTGELYELQPKRILKKTPTAWGIGAYLPTLAEAEYINLRSMRLGLSCFWKDIGAFLTDKVLGLMGSLPNTHLQEGGYLQKYGAKIRFRPEENPISYVMNIVGDVYPAFPDVWEDKLSDEALVRFCLHGLGPHRLERLADNQGFVVRTNMLASLGVREGYESYGGDCYIGSDFRPIKIVRMERRPGTSQWAPLTEQTYTPGSEGWEYAKFSFRSTLFTLVTVCDHLYGIHLQWSNTMVVAARERLSPEHPVRRLLTPYYFGTIQVNYIAHCLLVPPGTLGSRNFAFTDQSLQQAWRAMPSLLRDGAELKGSIPDAEYLESIFDCASYFARRTTDLNLELPYYDQATAFWNVTHQLVTDYLGLWFTDAEAALADVELQEFLVHVVGSLDVTAHLTHLVREMDARKRYAFAINVVCRLIFAVTAHHEAYGSVAVYAQDVSFCSFSWPKGEMCGTKITAVTQATLMAATSFPMPPLMSKAKGYHGFSESKFLRAPSATLRPKLNEICERHATAVAGLEKKCNDYVVTAPQRAFPFNCGLWCFNPRWMEASVSV